MVYHIFCIKSIYILNKALSVSALARVRKTILSDFSSSLNIQFLRQVDNLKKIVIRGKAEEQTFQG